MRKGRKFLVWVYLSGVLWYGAENTMAADIVPMATETLKVQQPARSVLGISVALLVVGVGLFMRRRGNEGR